MASGSSSAVADAAGKAGGRGSLGGGWAPLRYTAFRRWWLANLTSNVGTWMQTVAAQWLMISLTSSTLLVGAIQATNLPVLLLAIPAGVLGDLVDRKRVILAGQFVMLISAAALGVLDVAGVVTPALLLLLPLVARRTLGLGSGGYGLLLGCVGIGAVLGATFSPALRRAASPALLLGACAAAIAAATVVMVVSHTALLDGALLALAGTGWIVALGLLNASFQSALPSWVKARGMAYFTFVFQGATGVGALALAGVAEATSLDTGLVVLTIGLLLGGVLTFRLPLPAPGAIDVTPADAMALTDAPAETPGPVLVAVHYNIAEGSEAAFLAHSDRLRHFRQRTGGVEWRLFVDEDGPRHYVETFLVGSWEEHQRQHLRETQHDASLLAEIDGLLVSGTQRVAHHYLAARGAGSEAGHDAGRDAGRDAARDAEREAAPEARRDSAGDGRPVAARRRGSPPPACAAASIGRLFDLRE